MRATRPDCGHPPEIPHKRYVDIVSDYELNKGRDGLLLANTPGVSDDLRSSAPVSQGHDPG